MTFTSIYFLDTSMLNLKEINYFLNLNLKICTSIFNIQELQEKIDNGEIENFSLPQELEILYPLNSDSCSNTVRIDDGKYDSYTMFQSMLNFAEKEKNKYQYFYFVSKNKFRNKLISFYSNIKKYYTVTYPIQEDNYTGYRHVSNDEEIAQVYENKEEYYSNVYLNEYIYIMKDDKIKETFKRTANGIERVPHYSIESTMFGKIEPKDPYQNSLIDSFKSNKITLAGGPAGSGKTFLALAYLFHLLEKGKIDRIVIFCNPIVAKNAAKLGFYPGTVTEKLLSTQVGSILSSKIGDITEVEKMVNEGTLVLVPAGDARGYETPPRSGVYIMESQNLSIDLLKLILQRIGKECTTIVDGDRKTQTDMEIYASQNGMKRMSEVFRGKEIFGQVDLVKIRRSEIAQIAELM